MTIEDDIAVLARIATFEQFSFAALQIVAIGSETRNLADGETLFSAGETTDAGYVIQSGSLTLTTNDLKQPERSVSFGPGTLIGELALVTETVCAATAVAAGPTTVIRISRNLFRKVLEGFPDAALVTHERLLGRANQANAELVRIKRMLADDKAPRRAGEPSAANAGLNHPVLRNAVPGRAPAPGDAAPGDAAPGDAAPSTSPEKPRPWRRRRFGS
ncbi:MAG: Crp/Fnr family transcriptional regulator [Bradyrhizobiaceae bacterium]|nr:Crp/Fnr family transcriptional regulator [Bradyrhizobiaceae bacterium]